MPLDGYFLNRLKEEFKVLVNKRIRKIKMPNKRVVSLEFHNSDKGTLLFDLSPNMAHVRLSSITQNNDNHSFLNSLKQKLENALLISISQYKKDRILFFEFIKNDPFLGSLKRTLVFEVMGRTSHLILLDENNIVVDTFNKIFNEDKRSILPKIKYEPYPTNKEECSFEDYKSMSSPKEIFDNCLGFSKELAYYTYHNNLNLNKMPTTPNIYTTNKVNFHAFDFNIENQIKYDNLSIILEDYYKIDKGSSPLKKLVLKQIDNLNNKLSTLNDNYIDNSKYLNNKEIADNIYMSGLNLKEHYENFKDIKLNYDLNLNDNAQNFYKKYHKQKRSLLHLENQIALTNDKLTYFKDILENFNYFNNNDLNDLKEELTLIGLIRKKNTKRSTSPSYEIVKYNNATFYIGKSSIQNAYLYDKIARGNDLWFHIKDYPGPHVFMKGEISKDNLLKGASLATHYSKLKSSSNVLVNYTQVKNTKKIKGLGFKLALTNYKTIIYNF